MRNPTNIRRLWLVSLISTLVSLSGRRIWKFYTNFCHSLWYSICVSCERLCGHGRLILFDFSSFKRSLKYIIVKEFIFCKIHDSWKEISCICRSIKIRNVFRYISSVNKNVNYNTFIRNKKCWRAQRFLYKHLGRWMYTPHTPSQYEVVLTSNTTFMPLRYRTIFIEDIKYVTAITRTYLIIRHIRYKTAIRYREQILLD